MPPESGPAYLVGGFLRDALLPGASPSTADFHDLDLAVPLVGPELYDLARQLSQFLGSHAVPLGGRHWRDVLRLALLPAGPGQPAREIDLAGFGAGGIAADLARRDFTVNAMALPLPLWQPGPASNWAAAVIDPYGGRPDLARKLLRSVNPQIFCADPGRLLRAVRLAGQLQFRIDPETARQIRADAPLLEQVAPERVRDELLRILSAAGARGQLEVLDRLDLLCRILPELALTKGVQQPRNYHYWDVWNHLLHTVEHAELVTRGHHHSAIYSLSPWTAATAAHFEQEIGDGHTRRTLLKLAALLHDIAKPQTKQIDAAGRIRFFGHSEQGAAIVAERLTSLRFSSRSIALVSRMVEYHLRPAQLRQGAAMPSRRAIYRYFRDAGDAAIDTIYLALADYLAARGPEIAPDAWADHAAMLSYVLQTETGPDPAAATKPPRLLNGHDLMAHFQLSPGLLLGRLLAALDEAQAVGEITTKDQALEQAAALLSAAEM